MRVFTVLTVGGETLLLLPSPTVKAASSIHWHVICGF